MGVGVAVGLAVGDGLGVRVGDADGVLVGAETATVGSSARSMAAAYAFFIMGPPTGTPCRSTWCP